MYEIVKKPDGSFDLYQDGSLLLKLPSDRIKARELLVHLGRGSHWAGRIIRILNQKFPLPCYSFPSRSLCERIGVKALSEHFRTRGFKVFQPLPVSDDEAIEYLEQSGYRLEGIKNGVLYRSLHLILDDVASKVES